MLKRSKNGVEIAIKRVIALLLTTALFIVLTGCNGVKQQVSSEPAQTPNQDTVELAESIPPDTTSPENFVLISGGTFQMGSLESEAWRVEDETVHTVTVSDFYISRYEVTQAEYQSVMGENPSTFSGDDLPVESISWADAVRYCNARSTQRD